MKRPRIRPQPTTTTPSQSPSSFPFSILILYFASDAVMGRPARSRPGSPPALVLGAVGRADRLGPPEGRGGDQRGVGPIGPAGDGAGRGLGGIHLTGLEIGAPSSAAIPAQGGRSIYQRQPAAIDLRPGRADRNRRVRGLTLRVLRRQDGTLELDDLVPRARRLVRRVEWGPSAGAARSAGSTCGSRTPR